MEKKQIKIILSTFFECYCTKISVAVGLNYTNYVIIFFFFKLWATSGNNLIFWTYICTFNCYLHTKFEVVTKGRSMLIYYQKHQNLAKLQQIERERVAARENVTSYIYDDI